MIKTGEQNIKTNGQEFATIDPRIDSPDIKVIYPSPIEQMEKEVIQKGKPDRSEIQPMEELPPQELLLEKKEEHTCKVDIQEAVKQNFLGFIVLVILSLGIGYLIGKK
jgi:hypothetical protein